jgi:ribosomal protein L37E
MASFLCRDCGHEWPEEQTDKRYYCPQCGYGYPPLVAASEQQPKVGDMLMFAPSNYAPRRVVSVHPSDPDVIWLDSRVEGKPPLVVTRASFCSLYHVPDGSPVIWRDGKPERASAA